MNIELPPVIAAFFHATNTREFADFLSLFTADAHVNDEANDYYGAEIGGWIDRATADTKPTADVTDITRDGEQLTVTAQLSGNFPGSPIPASLLLHTQGRQDCHAAHQSMRP